MKASLGTPTAVHGVVAEDRVAAESQAWPTSSATKAGFLGRPASGQSQDNEPGGQCLRPTERLLLF